MLKNCSDFSVLELREVDFDRLDIDLSKCRCLIEGLQDWWDGDGRLIVVYPWRSAWHWRLCVLFPCVAWLPLHWLNVWMHLVHRRRQGTGLLLCVVVVSRTIISLALLRWVSFPILAWRWWRPALNRGTLCLGMLRLVNLRWTSTIMDWRNLLDSFNEQGMLLNVVRIVHKNALGFKVTMDCFTLDSFLLIIMVRHRYRVLLPECDLFCFTVGSALLQSSLFLFNQINQS